MSEQMAQELRELEAQRDRIARAFAAAKGLAEVRGHLRDEAVARVASLEATLREIADATSEPGIAARAHAALEAPKVQAGQPIAASQANHLQEK